MIVINQHEAGPNEYCYISIFYDASGWHHLVAKIADTFNQLNYNESACYMIHFGNHRGQFVGISCYGKNLKSVLALSFLDSEFKAFLKTNPTKRGRNKPGQSIFKNIQNNSIRYNQHGFPFLKYGCFSTHDSITLSLQITSIINELLLSEEITEEQLFTLAFYLHLLLYRAISQHYNIKFNDLLKAIESGSSPLADDVKSCAAIFSESKDTLIEIYNDLDDEEWVLRPENKWMREWQKQCINCLKPHLLLKETGSYKVLLPYLTDFNVLVNKQLAININIPYLIKLCTNYS